MRTWTGSKSVLAYAEVTSKVRLGYTFRLRASQLKPDFKKLHADMRLREFEGVFSSLGTLESPTVPPRNRREARMIRFSTPAPTCRASGAKTSIASLAVLCL